MTFRALYRAEQLLTLSAPTGPVLGIDTASSFASLALIAEGRVLAEISEPATSHGATLPITVARILGRTGLGPADLAAVAVGTGPGSFTGLRVGLSYAKGLAMAGGCAIVGVPSLDSMALSALEKGMAGPGETICPVLDARKGEVYAALYRVGADAVEKVSDDLVVTLEYLVPRIQSDVVFVGDAMAEKAGALINAQCRRAAVLNNDELCSRGRMVAVMGAEALMRNETHSAATLQPLYVRPAEAVLNQAGKNFGERSYGAQRGRSHPAARPA
jgi:tRNA threonylcarbamoyladenosine biosynthesis protein TsaB